MCPENIFSSLRFSRNALFNALKTFHTFSFTIKKILREISPSMVKSFCCIDSFRSYHSHDDWRSFCRMYVIYVISPNLLVWRSCGKARFPYSFGPICRDCTFPQNFHTRKLGEIIAFYAVRAYLKMRRFARFGNICTI